MTIIKSRQDEIPAFPPGYEEEMKALAEKPDSEIDLSDMPELDEFDFKYSIPFSELLTMTDNQRSNLAKKIQDAKKADRAAKKAQQEAEQAIAEARQLAHQT